MHPLPEDVVDAHLAPKHRPDIDRAVKPLTRGMILREAMRLVGGVYRRRCLTVPTLFVFGRNDHPWADHVEHLSHHSERYADRAEFTYVDNASHFLTDDNPAAVATLIRTWLTQAT